MSIARNLYTYILMAPILVSIIAYWTIVSVDPYDVRAGGMTPKIAEHRYPHDEWPLLINSITEQPHDLVMVGGSTIMWFTPEMINQAFPKYSQPLNLSYVAPGAKDIGDFLQRILMMEHLDHVVLTMDFSLMSGQGERSKLGENLQRIENSNLYRAGDFSLTTALASLHRIIKGHYDLPSWSKLDRPYFFQSSKPVTEQPRRMAQIEAAILQHENTVFNDSSMQCNMLPFLDQELSPFLRKAREANIQVDLVFPAYPYLMYYDWMTSQRSSPYLLPEPLFDQFSVYKRCTVELVESFHHDKFQVLAVDNEPDISGDISLYMDMGHVLNETAYEKWLIMIAEGRFELTVETLPLYLKSLRSNIEKSAEEFVANN